VNVSIRRARPDDVPFLVELLTSDEVEPYLAASRSRSEEEIGADVERSLAEPEAYGRIVIDVDGARAGAMEYERVNVRSRIAQVGGLALHPDYRGRGVADEGARRLQRYLFELGFHRLQMEIYGFNERAQRHAERAGWVEEGRRRKAYRRHGEWVDGVLYGLVAEDRRMTSMTRYLHTMYRITDPEKSRPFYEALGLELRRDMDIVRNGQTEATNYFFGVPGQEEELELTYNHDGRTYDLGTGYGHIALAVDDLDATLEQLRGQGIEPEREPYRVREGGSRLCFVRDPDGYRIELIDRSGK
jgi:lactoylglutathione lyase